MRNMSRFTLSVALVGVLGLAACGGSSGKTPASKTTDPSAVPSSTDASGHVAIPVSADPSKSAKMICESEVQGDVAERIGLQVTKPLVGKWADHVYSCDYTYGTAVMTLAVKEFANQAETDAYFASLATKLGKTANINSLGQGAFTTTNQSTVVRKDYKVLLVDISKLPAEFGKPPDKRGNIALDIAAVIMSCWTGA